MFATLGFGDLFWIWLIVTLCVSTYAGGTAAYARLKPSDTARFRRVDAKLDLILRHLGLEYEEPATPVALSDDVKALADDSTKQAEAIALHREQTGAGPKEAEEAVAAYIADSR